MRTKLYRLMVIACLLMLASVSLAQDSRPPEADTLLHALGKRLQMFVANPSDIREFLNGFNRFGAREVPLHERSTLRTGVNHILHAAVGQRRKVAEEVRSPIPAANLCQDDFVHV